MSEIPSTPITPQPLITVENVVTRLRTLGYDAIDDDLALVEYTIRKVGTDIMNYCNVDKVPPLLRFRYIDAVCGEILQLKLSQNALPNLAPVVNGVTSIKQGDTQVSFGESTQSEQLSKQLEALALTKGELNRFRRLVW